MLLVCKVGTYFTGKIAGYKPIVGVVVYFAPGRVRLHYLKGSPVDFSIDMPEDTIITRFSPLTGAELLEWKLCQSHSEIK